LLSAATSPVGRAGINPLEDITLVLCNMVPPPIDMRVLGAEDWTITCCPEILAGVMDLLLALYSVDVDIFVQFF
jgi:hypothetical protein